MEKKIVLSGNRWLVNDVKEKQAEPFTIKLESQSQSVHLTECQGNTFLVEGESKAAAVILDGCRDISILIKVGILSNLELINCRKIKVQLDKAISSINIDGSDTISIYLMESPEQTTFYTAKTSEVNIVFGKGDDNNDGLIQEISLPEQFKSYFDQNLRLITQPVQHASA